jgi:hypothetical protein
MSIVGEAVLCGAARGGTNRIHGRAEIMSAAFALSPSGPPAPCGFPKCELEAFHPGDHQVPSKAPQDKRLQFPGPRYGTCVVCRAKFVQYGDHAHPASSICGSTPCAIELSRREAEPARLLCPCPQRPYPHELSVHKQLRSESYHPKLRFRYPWSLARSERLELSTEKD